MPGSDVGTGAFFSEEALSNSGLPGMFCTISGLTDQKRGVALSLDKMSICFQLPELNNRYKSYWKKWLLHTIDDTATELFRESHLFKYHWKMNGFDIQTEFQKGPEDYLRIEWNPCKDDLSGLDKVFKFFPKVLLDYLRVTRLDVAIDYYQELDPFMFATDLKRKGFVFKRGQGMQTVYFGTRNSPVEICIYDKRAQMNEEEGAQISHSWWRVEARFRKGFNLGDNPANPFKGMKCYSAYSGDDLKMKWFMAYVRERTLECALGELERHIRCRYKNFLQECVELVSPSKVFDMYFLQVWRKYRQYFENSFYSSCYHSAGGL